MKELDKTKDTDGAMIVFKSIVVDDVGIVISMKDGKWSMAVSGKTKELVVDLDFIDDLINRTAQATRERDIAIVMECKDIWNEEDFKEVCHIVASQLRDEALNNLE